MNCRYLPLRDCVEQSDAGDRHGCSSMPSRLTPFCCTVTTCDDSVISCCNSNHRRSISLIAGSRFACPMRPAKSTRKSPRSGCSSSVRDTWNWRLGVGSHLLQHAEQLLERAHALLQALLEFADDQVVFLVGGFAQRADALEFGAAGANLREQLLLPVFLLAFGSVRRRSRSPRWSTLRPSRTASSSLRGSGRWSPAPPPPRRLRPRRSRPGPRPARPH
jgi:hypothetical protein